MNVRNLSNEYADLIALNRVPKSVLAAIALSLAVRLVGEDKGWLGAVAEIETEWQALYSAGIVPQLPKPLRSWISLYKKEKPETNDGPMQDDGLDEPMQEYLDQADLYDEGAPQG